MVCTVFSAVWSEWNVAEPRFPQSSEEADESAEKVCEGTAKGSAEDAEDGAEEHEISVALTVLPGESDESPQKLEFLPIGAGSMMSTLGQNRCGVRGLAFRHRDSRR
jgi:hypothetical protein